jgi:hypothetical protein
MLPLVSPLAETSVAKEERKRQTPQPVEDAAVAPQSDDMRPARKGESQMFSIGQKVMCVDGKPRKNGMCRHTDEVLINVGSIYTVREIIDARGHGCDEDALLLEEIRNPIRVYVTPAGPERTEVYFFASRFRPLRTANIDVFTKMQEPTRARELEPVY